MGFGFGLASPALLGQPYAQRLVRVRVKVRLRVRLKVRLRLRLG